MKFRQIWSHWFPIAQDSRSFILLFFLNVKTTKLKLSKVQGSVLRPLQTSCKSVVIYNWQSLLRLKFSVVTQSTVNSQQPAPSFFKKMGQPRPLFVYFRLFKQTLQFLKQINVKKCPSSIQHRDSNSQPFDYKSPPLTTRPGLPKADGFVCRTKIIFINANDLAFQLQVGNRKKIFYTFWSSLFCSSVKQLQRQIIFSFEN